MEQDQDIRETEITLGTGRLLGLFFGLVTVCALFFSLGYMFGRGSGTGAVHREAANASPGSANRAADKPFAGSKPNSGSPNCAAGSPGCSSETPGSGSNL